MNQPAPLRQLLARRLLWQGAVTGAFVGAATLVIDSGELREAATLPSLRWLPLALALFTTAKYIDSWRWRYLLRGVGPPPQRALFGVFLIGNAVNNVLPLRAGDFAKIQVLANRYGASRAGLAASVFAVEASLDAAIFALFLFVAFTAGGLGGVPALTPRSVGALAAGGAAIFIGALLLARTLSARARPLLLRAADGLYALRSWRRAVVALALSLPAWLLEAGMFALFGQALGLELSYPSYIVVMVAANLAVAVPIALWNIGPYEALVVGVLASAGVDEATALSYAVSVHLLTNAWIVATGLVAFWAMRVRPREVFALQ